MGMAPPVARVPVRPPMGLPMGGMPMGPRPPIVGPPRPFGGGFRRGPRGY